MAEAARSASELARRLSDQVQPLRGAASDWDGVLRAIGGARYVLLGEATHGTHEFYALRAELTRRLIRERGFNAVAAEADWPPSYRLNCWARGHSRDRSAHDALSGFERFPTWMWRNTVMLEFAAWLREHNQTGDRQVGFYGIDLYSLHASIHAVIESLERTDPALAAEARERYACFEAFGGDPQRYGYVASFGFRESCEQDVVAQLLKLQARRAELTAGAELGAEEALFVAEQNARVVRNAEEYYRAMYRGGIASWNLRDTHMADTVDALAGHLGRQGRPAKLVIWAHNSHLGDARATELGADGELNLGQLLRQRHPNETYLFGFSTYDGTVTAASDWDGPSEQKRVRPALPGSYEALFHALGIPQFWFEPKRTSVASELAKPRLQRAIGVVYRPATERQSHYYHVNLADQFDGLLHLDRTRALSPLERYGRVEEDELPETYPSGM